MQRIVDVLEQSDLIDYPIRGLDHDSRTADRIGDLCVLTNQFLELPNTSLAGRTVMQLLELGILLQDLHQFVRLGLPVAFRNRIGLHALETQLPEFRGQLVLGHRLIPSDQHRQNLLRSPACGGDFVANPIIGSIECAQAGRPFKGGPSRSDQRHEGFAILQPILQRPVPILAPGETAPTLVHEHRALTEHPGQIPVQMTA
jgi:hypothetical protein